MNILAYFEIAFKIIQQVAGLVSDLKVAHETNDQPTLDAIRERLDAVADSLASPPGGT